MKKEHLKYLLCPKHKRKLELKEEVYKENRIKSGKLFEPISGSTYPIIDFIPRFVPLENYANNFGLEWNKHSRTLFDESSGFSISQERYEKETRWGYGLAGEIILEAGSGSGRFTKHLVDTHAMVISFDYSNAVDANYRSNGHQENLLIVQASVYEMPFPEGFFDRVLGIGVIQHTPDPRKTFNCLVKAVKPGGYLCTDTYLKSIGRVYLTPKYLVRKITKRMDPEKLYKWTASYVNFIWPLARMISKIPKIGRNINWRLMVADYTELLPNADSKTLKEWAILDTYDMVSPAYDFPQTLKNYTKWHQEEGLHEIDVHYGYNGIEGRARKKE